MRILLPLLLVGFFAGCSSSVRVLKDLHGQTFAADAEPIAHVYGETSGVYLFYVIPICTGDPQTPGGWSVFRDGTHPTRTAQMVLAEAERLGGDRVTDLTTYSDSVWGGGTFFIFWYRWTAVSANVSKSKKKAPAAPPPPLPKK